MVQRSGASVAAGSRRCMALVVVSSALAAGCYASHRREAPLDAGLALRDARPARDAPSRADAPPRRDVGVAADVGARIDAGPPRDAGASDTGPPRDTGVPYDFGPPRDAGPGCPDYEPTEPCADVRSVAPIVHLPLDSDLVDHGSRGVWHGTASGVTEFVPSPRGGALRLTGRNFVTLVGTATLLREEAGTFSIWIAEPEGPSDGKNFLQCRTFYSGFETYRGVYPDRFSSCFGAGHPSSGPGGCADGTLCHGGWHHLVIRVFGPRAPLEVFRDGELVHVVPTEWADVLYGAADLSFGDQAGGAPWTGTVVYDDLRVYAEALADDEVLTVTRCPVP